MPGLQQLCPISASVGEEAEWSRIVWGLTRPLNPKPITPLWDKMTVPETVCFPVSRAPRPLSLITELAQTHPRPDALVHQWEERRSTSRLDTSEAQSLLDPGRWFCCKHGWKQQRRQQPEAPRSQARTNAHQWEKKRSEWSTSRLGTLKATTS